MKKIVYISKSSMKYDSRVKNIAASLCKANYDVTVIAEKRFKDLSYSEQREYLIKRLFTISGLYAVEEAFSSTKNTAAKTKKTLKSLLRNNKLRILIIVFLNRIIWNKLCLLEIIKRKPNLIIARDPNTLFIAHLASRLLKIPLFYDSHEIWSSSNLYLNSSRFMQRFWDRIESKITPKLDCIFITTATKKEIIEQKYNLQGVTVLRNTSPMFELDEKRKYDFRQEFDIPSTNKIIIYHGQISRIRGIYDIVEAIRSLSHISLIFMGMGTDVADLMYYVKDKNISNVFFKKAVPPEEVIPTIAGGDIGVQPFHYSENIYSETSIKLFECMMAELACIGVSFPEIKAVIEGKNIGLCYESGNIDMLKEKIIALTTDETLLAQAKANAREFKHEYAWETDEKVLLERVYASIGN
ncbi:MAG TPA: glycosyltransferase [Candidatus Cloacimonadota bacterium]|nr:glycosyltransferase [Candidatus Cloacimonadota bacterium]